MANGCAYTDIRNYLAAKGMTQTHGAPHPDAREDQPVSPVDEERDQSTESLPTWELEQEIERSANCYLPAGRQATPCGMTNC